MNTTSRTVALLALVAGCPSPKPPTGAATPTEADAFVKKADALLREAWVARDLAGWDYATDLTDEKAAKAAAEEEATMAVTSALVEEAGRYANVEGIDEATARQIHLLRLSTPLPSPKDAEKRAELAALTSTLAGMYGKGEYCKDGVCRDLGQLEDVLAKSRNPDELLDAWAGWRTVSPAMKPHYARFVELANEGARDQGFTDVGASWRLGYDMPAADVEAETDRLWKQVEPLYEQLHCYVRHELGEKYGTELVPQDGPMPAHLLGNMWSQEWGNIYDIVAPYPESPSIDVTAALAAKGWDEMKMVKAGEGFFTSLGLQPLPETFWERSMFLQPEGREVQCHASAWDVQWNGDVRIKMCIKRTADDFRTIHHELGHDYYFLYYKQHPVLFQNGAHDGFHEAIGDVLALSITPKYLQEVGLIGATVEPTPESVVNDQMVVALDKIAFLPFARMIDQWRWDVFSGEITPEEYNQAWWDLVLEYQGLVPPVARTEADFDPGAKYHIPANTPYLRYFFAAILQFQLYDALCKTAGHEGPLHTCTLYGSEEAGTKLAEMLTLGASQPWPDALEKVTGTRQMDAQPMVTYFDPLMTWLEEQNTGRECGWQP